MRIFIRLIYKSAWMVLFLFRTFLTTCAFRVKLWINNVEYGKNVTCSNAVASLLISKSSGRVKIGNNVAFNNYDGPSWNSRCCLQVKRGGVLTIGDNSGLNGVYVHCSKSVEIGQWVKVGGGTLIMDSDFHPLDYIYRRKSFEGMKSCAIVIDDDVFIGARCIICKGVKIGRKSIVAAGSVVVKDIPAGEVWGGNPAKYIRDIQS